MVKLYRPVGFKEMDLILNTGSRRFPPRLPIQPIFYPVLNIDYATEIAQKWNTKDENSGFVGYVTEFEVDSNYISSFEPHIVGASIHQELWVPAESLEDFNHHIQKNILIVKAYYGSEFTGKSSVDTQLKDKNYKEQFVQLNGLKKLNVMDYMCEVLVQWKIITQNYFLWESIEFSEYNIHDTERDLLLQSMKKIMLEKRKWFIK